MHVDRRLSLALAFLSPCWACAVLAAEPPKPQTRPTQPAEPQLAPEERAEKIRQNMRRTAELFKSAKYAEAEQCVREGMALAPDDPTFPYNLACALARQGRKADAMEALERSIKLGYNEPDHMKADEDLASLYEDPAFKKLLKEAEANRIKALGKYEEGEELPGIRTVEGNPEAGLRWRLRLPSSATKEKPSRMIVWLHPSGGSMNKPIERLAPDLAKRGYALLVLTQKNFAGWSDQDAQRLIKSTLPEVGKLEGVVADRPILLGYSAGGQMALVLYTQSPGQYGGLILDAAYPLIPRPDGRFIPLAPPKDEAARKVPIFAIVGAQDGGSVVWQTALASWRAAGIPLVLHIIPNARHQWLFGKDQLETLYKWLDEVRAGKLPSADKAQTRPSTKVIL